MTQAEIIEAINAQESILQDRQAKLTSYDYIGTKISMGVATREEYAEKIAETIQWRKDKDAATAEIKRLRALKPEEEPKPSFEDGV